MALAVNSVGMGGVEEHVRQLAVGLHAHGVDVKLVCPESASVNPLAAAATAAGIEVRRLTLSNEVNAVGRVARLLGLVRLLRTERIQVLHVHLIGYSGGRWLILAAKLARVSATVVTVHIGPPHTQPFAARLERRLMNLLVDRFIAVSEAGRHLQLEHLGQSAAKTLTIPNAVELDRYERVSVLARLQVRRRFGIPDDAPVIGSVARLDPQKGLTYLLAAIPQLLARAKNLHVLVVGEGPLRGALEEQSYALDIGDRIHFAGYQADIPGYLSAMDLFVLPSLFEGLPLVVLEAMAAGLPVVATRVDGIPEAVEDGVTGILIPPADPSALANAAGRILEDAPAAAAMGEASRLRARSFSRDALIDRVGALYLAALARSRFHRDGRGKDDMQGSSPSHTPRSGAR